MENKILVSIIMPTYNCAKYISESIESVINQTIDNWELLIADDCSTDDTPAVVEKYLIDSRIKYWCLAQNSGPDVARTEALRKAQGKYIAFLDSDDIWYPEKLKRQIEYMESNNIDFSCTAYEQMDENGERLGIKVFPLPKVNYNKCIRRSNPIGNLTAMYNQEKLGKFEVPKIRKRNDFALWLQVLKKTDYCYGMQEVLGAYRTGRKESVSSNKLKQMKYHWQLYHHIERHNLIRSSFEIMCWVVVKGGQTIMKH